MLFCKGFLRIYNSYNDCLNSYYIIPIVYNLFYYILYGIQDMLNGVFQFEEIDDRRAPLLLHVLYLGIHFGIDIAWLCSHSFIPFRQLPYNIFFLRLINLILNLAQPPTSSIFHLSTTPHTPYYFQFFFTIYTSLSPTL